MPHDDLGMVPFECQQYNVENAMKMVQIRMYLCPGYKILVEDFVRVTVPFFVSKGDTEDSVFSYEVAESGDVQIINLAENLTSYAEEIQK